MGKKAENQNQAVDEAFPSHVALYSKAIDYAV